MLWHLLSPVLNLFSTGGDRVMHCIADCLSSILALILALQGRARRKGLYGPAAGSVPKGLYCCQCGVGARLWVMDGEAQIPLHCRLFQNCRHSDLV